MAGGMAKEPMIHPNVIGRALPELEQTRAFETRGEANFAMQLYSAFFEAVVPMIQLQYYYSSGWSEMQAKVLCEAMHDFKCASTLMNGAIWLMNGAAIPMDGAILLIKGAVTLVQSA